MLQILPVDNRELQQQFLQLPADLHQEQGLWISPCGDEEAGLVGFATHPVNDQSTIQAWLAVDAGRPCGRIAAIDNPEFRRRHGRGRGLFGFFECSRNETVVRQLVGAAANWLSMRGCNTMRGPFQPNANYHCGVLVDGFDSLPTTGMAWNPPWYGELLEASGMRKACDLLSLSGHVEMLADLTPRVRRIARLAESRFRVSTRHFEFPRLERDLCRYFDVFNQAIPGQWSALPITAAEVDYLVDSYRTMLTPEFTALAEIDGEPVGAVLGIPDLNPLLRQTMNRRWPADWRQQPELCRQIRRVRLAVTVVQNRYNRWGIGPLMHLFLLDSILQNSTWLSHLREVEYSWILENNLLSRGSLESGGARLDKVHRIYEKQIVRGK